MIFCFELKVFPSSVYFYGDDLNGWIRKASEVISKYGAEGCLIDLQVIFNWSISAIPLLFKRHKMIFNPTNVTHDQWITH